MKTAPHNPARPLTRLLMLQKRCHRKAGEKKDHQESSVCVSRKVKIQPVAAKLNFCPCS